jgi:phosphohistidine phosphatase SixA
MRNFILKFCLLISFIACQKTENDDSASKIQPFLFIKLDTSQPVFSIPDVVNYRNLSLPDKPLVNSNQITLNNIGVYTVMANSGKKDSTLVKIFVSNDPEKFKMLSDGSTYAIVARHSDADVGQDDFNSKTTDWWKSCDSKMARQINQNGIKYAKSVGEHIKLWKLPVGELYTSEFCRNVQTIENMKLGPFKTTKELTYVVYGTDHSKDALNLMKQLPINNKVHILIGHSQLRSLRPGLSTLDWNDAFIYKLESGKEPAYIGLIKNREWIEY